MDKFQVYNRELNTWEDEKIELISGWNENFVLDKTTDRASVKLKYKDTTAPNWNIGDWCRFLHSDEVEYESIIYSGDRVLPVEDYFEVDYEVVNADTIVFTFKIRANTTEEIVSDVVVKYTTTGSSNDEYTVTSRHTFNVDNDYTSTYTFRNPNAENVDIYQIRSVYLENTIPEKLMEYDNVYIPMNHEQYIIRNITMVQDLINEEIDIQLEVVEPIEFANGVLVETMSHTNQISKKVDDTVYVHEKLNHLSVLEKVLKVTPANNDTYEDGYVKANNKSWFNRIKIVDKELLQSLAFNDETYSELSLYDILLNKYDSSIGRTPVIYFDINANTDLPRNINRPEYILRFERQDGFDREDIQLADLLLGAKEVITNKSGDNYAEGLISNYENLNANNEIYAPSKTLWLVPEIDSNKRSTTEFNEDYEPLGNWVLKTPHAIKKINSIERFYIDSYSNTDAGLYYTKTEKLNYSSEAILEEKEYVASEKYYNENNCVWFTEGTNTIHLNEVYYQQIQSSSSGYVDNGLIWVYKVEYEPLISGRFDLGKDYQVQINQDSSQIDNYKFGKYLQEYLASMNKSDMIVTVTVENFNEIKEIGTRVINEDKVYLITNVSIQNRGFEYDVVYQLNENHIRKSDTIQAPQEIRKNIAIGIDATKERKSMLTYNAGISYRLQDENLYKTELSGELLNQMFSQLNDENTDMSKEIQLAHLTFNSTLVDQNENIQQYSISRLCEIARYYMNNTICFNMRYFDNAEAGKNKTLQKENINLIGTVFFGVPKQQIPILYTDPFGEFETFDIKFINVTQKDITEIEPDINISNTSAPTSTAQRQAMAKYLNEINPSIDILATYPLTDVVPSENIDTPVAEIKNIQYFKDMLDTFNYTIGFHYNVSKDIILCKNFFENSTLMQNYGESLAYYRIFDRNVTEEDLPFVNDIGTGWINVQSKTEETLENININKVTFITQNDLDRAKSIVIQKGNPYSIAGAILIINNFNETGKTFSIYHS